MISARAIRDKGINYCSLVPNAEMAANAFAEDAHAAKTIGRNKHIAKSLGFKVLGQLLEKSKSLIHSHITCKSGHSLSGHPFSPVFSSPRPKARGIMDYGVFFLYIIDA
ncbi:MAG: hypothetical protein ACI4S4_00345 [Candidatus Ornithospirochaeta sp.]